MKVTIKLSCIIKNVYGIAVEYFFEFFQNLKYFRVRLVSKARK